MKVSWHPSGFCESTTSMIIIPPWANAWVNDGNDVWTPFGLPWPFLRPLKFITLLHRNRSAALRVLAPFFCLPVADRASLQLNMMLSM